MSPLPQAIAARRVRVYVVTFRRPELLERALNSLTKQSHQDWIAEVLNDDPSDARVPQVIEALGDARIALSQPSVHRGGTGNFNHAFGEVSEPFASILEDDNWWEPEFLTTMLAALDRHPEAAIACGNERVWEEGNGGKWTDTGRNVRADTEGEQLLQWSALDQCGSAKLCNSSLLFRTFGSGSWRTPETIPIDVTEHFRERVTPHPIILVQRPLVNYGLTLETNRARKASVWAGYQVMLIGSVFALGDPAFRQTLAGELWKRARGCDPLLTTTLIATGLTVPESSILWRQARFLEKLRFALGILRHPLTAISVSRTLIRHPQEWEWLQRGAFAEFMKGDGKRSP